MTRRDSSETEAGPGSEENKVNFRDPAVFASLLIPTLFGTYLLLTSTTTLIQGIWPYDTKRILQFGLLVGLFLLTCLNGKIRNQYVLIFSAVPAWLRLILTGLFAWGILSALINAETLAHALNSLADVSLLAALLLGLFAVAACRRIGGIWYDRIAVGLLALTSVAIGLQELIGVVAAHASGLDFSYRISLLHFSWPRFYNQVQTWSVPMLFAIPALFGRRPLYIILCLLALSLQWYVLLVTGARGSILALMLAMIWSFVFFPFLRRSLIPLQLMGLVFAVLIFVLVALSFQANNPANAATDSAAQIQKSVKNPSAPIDYAQDNPDSENKFLSQSLGRPLADSSGRIWMWKTAWHQARTHAWFGIGPMNFVCTKPPWFGHPHNFPLRIAAEWGIPAALLICLVAAFLLISASWRLRSSAENDLTLKVTNGLLLTSVIAAAIHACLSGVMVMPASQTTGLLIGGMLLGSVGPSRKEIASRLFRIPVAAGLILSMGLAVYGLHELKTMNRRAERIPPVESLVPRLWQDSRVCTLTTGRIHVKE